MASGTVLSRDAVLELTGTIHSPHPCGSPYGQPAAVQIGYPADLSRRVPEVMPLTLPLAPKLVRNAAIYQAKPIFIITP